MEGLELCQAQRAAAGAHLGLQQSSLLCSLEDEVLTQIVLSAPASFTVIGQNFYPILTST